MYVLSDLGYVHGIFFCVCVWCIHTCRYAEARGFYFIPWRPSLSLNLELGCQAASPRDSDSAFSPHTALALQAHVRPCLASDVAAGALNSGLHACAAVLIPTEPLPQSPGS